MTTITSSYLTEDLAQILRYFPGAQPVTLDTPFELTDKPVPAKTITKHQQKPSQAESASASAGAASVLAACLIPLSSHRSLPWTTR